MKFLIILMLIAWIYPIIAYRTYYVEDECTSQKDLQKVVYNIPANGPNSVGEMKTNRFGTYSRTGRSCLIKLIPPKGYGVIVTLKKVDFRNHEPCEDYLKIYTDDGDGVKVCGYFDGGKDGRSFYSQGRMEILYHTEDGGFGFNDGFKLIFTVAKSVDQNECSIENQFKCANSRCIWIGATCDGQNNCGDLSDESTDGNAKCPSITPITVAVIALAITTTFAVMVAVCLCCCRIQYKAAAKAKTPTDFPSRPNGGYLPLPGYVYATPEQDLTHLVYNPYHSGYPSAPTTQRKTTYLQDHLPQQSALDLPPPYIP